MRIFLSSLAINAMIVMPAQTGNAGYLNPALSPEQRARDPVARMTLEEKATQTLNTEPAIPRLGVPEYDYWNEGLHGVARSGYSTLFPQAIGMAATWDAPLLEKTGEVVSTEARTKYNDAVRHGVHSIYFGLTIWSPKTNIFRDPRWGGGQETYGEDPYLTGTLGLNFIEGLQGPDPARPRVVATPKHFAVHSGPVSARHCFDVDPSAHDLGETYLPQFRTAIVEGRADSIMRAYNAVDGKPACASDLLLKTVLRMDWEFGGFITSDCGAIDDFYEKSAHNFSPDAEHAAATALLTGVDTNCGSIYKALPAAVQHGLLTQTSLDTAAKRLFVARFKLGLFDDPAAVLYAQIPFSEDRSGAHLALSLKTVNESMVLLKNDGILPLLASQYRTIAVIGSNAASLSALEGNYNAVPKDPQMPIEALREAFPDARVIYAEGAPYADGAALPISTTMLRPSLNSAVSGLRAEYFVGDAQNMSATFSGKPVTTRTDAQVDFDWNSATPVDGLAQDASAVRWTGYILPPRPGDFEFNVRLAHCYPCGDREHFDIKVNGKNVSAYATKGEEGRESITPRFHVNFADTKPHAIELEYTHHAPLFGPGITLEWVPPPGVLQAEAVKAAQEADLVIAMIGLSPELEGEEMKVQVEGFAGGDRTDIKLPASQLLMLEQRKATGKPIVAVLLNGSALAVTYAQQHANAILEAWYPSEFCGKAIAQPLKGENNPAGRLPVTFYNSVADLPAFDSYSMKNRTYRYFTGSPEYGFGSGLSYTQFSYANLRLDRTTLRAGDVMTATAAVTNTGSTAGDEVVELYLGAPKQDNSGLSPLRQLEGFQRNPLNQGETRQVSFTLTPRQISQVDAQGARAVQPGIYTVAIGGSQPADRQAAAALQTTTFRIEGTQTLPQ